MKTNLIVGKKQIILASLVLVLGVAVYLNWSFARSEEQFEPTGLTATDIAATDTDMPTTDTVVPVDPAAEPIITDDANAIPDDTAVDAPADSTVTVDETASDEEPVKHLGDAKLVSAQVIADENYFAKAKLTRSKARDEAIQTISAILDDEKLTEADKKQATEKALTITDIIEAESKIENLVKAKGFEECMVYISGENASVVVKTPELDQDGATQIKNIIVNEGLIRGENVSITEVN